MSGYHDRPEYRALLAAVRAVPEDDLPRLVLADWLDENGEVERAELIRVQCSEVYRRPCEKPTYPLRDDGHPDLDVPCLAFHRGDEDACLDACEPCRLRHRGLQLLLLWDHGDTRHVPHPFTGNGWTGMVVKTYERGLLHTVRCTLDQWCGGECGRCENGRALTGREWMSGVPCPECHGTGRTTGIGPRVVSRHPVEKVEVVDREPRPNSVDDDSVVWWGWYVVGELAVRERYDLPTFLDEHFEPRPGSSRWRTFPTHDLARAALSAALIRWAESQTPSEVTT